MPTNSAPEGEKPAPSKPGWSFGLFAKVFGQEEDPKDAVVKEAAGTRRKTTHRTVPGGGASSRHKAAALASQRGNASSRKVAKDGKETKREMRRDVKREGEAKCKECKAGSSSEEPEVPLPADRPRPPCSWTEFTTSTGNKFYMHEVRSWPCWSPPPAFHLRTSTPRARTRPALIGCAAPQPSGRVPPTTRRAGDEAAAVEQAKGRRRRNDGEHDEASIATHVVRRIA